MRPPSSFETRPSGAPQDEADLANAPPPVFFAAPGRPSSKPLAPQRTEGARDAKGPDGPADLDASRHRGLSKSGGPPSPFRATARQAASPPNPRRPARGVFRFAPHRPRWTSHFRHPALLTERLSTATGPNGAQHIWPCRLPPSVGPSDARMARRDEAAWTAGTSRRISDAKEFPGHRSPPRVWRR